MADYLRLSSDDSMKADQKLALAASGWLLGKWQGDAEPGGCDQLV